MPKPHQKKYLGRQHKHELEKSSFKVSQLPSNNLNANIIRDNQNIVHENWEKSDAQQDGGKEETNIMESENNDLDPFTNDYLPTSRVDRADDKKVWEEENTLFVEGMSEDELKIAIAEIETLLSPELIQAFQKSKEEGKSIVVDSVGDDLVEESKEEEVEVNLEGEIVDVGQVGGWTMRELEGNLRSTNKEARDITLKIIEKVLRKRRKLLVHSPSPYSCSGVSEKGLVPIPKSLILSLIYTMERRSFPSLRYYFVDGVDEEGRMEELEKNNGTDLPPPPSCIHSSYQPQSENEIKTQTPFRQILVNLDQLSPGIGEDCDENDLEGVLGEYSHRPLIGLVHHCGLIEKVVKIGLTNLKTMTPHETESLLSLLLHILWSISPQYHHHLSPLIEFIHQSHPILLSLSSPPSIQRRFLHLVSAINPNQKKTINLLQSHIYPLFIHYMDQSDYLMARTCLSCIFKIGGKDRSFYEFLKSTQSSSDESMTNKDLPVSQFPPSIDHLISNITSNRQIDSLLGPLLLSIHHEMEEEEENKLSSLLKMLLVLPIDQLLLNYPSTLSNLIDIVNPPCDEIIHLLEEILASSTVHFGIVSHILDDLKKREDQQLSSQIINLFQNSPSFIFKIPSPLPHSLMSISFSCSLCFQVEVLLSLLPLLAEVDLTKLMDICLLLPSLHHPTTSLISSSISPFLPPILSQLLDEIEREDGFPFPLDWFLFPLSHPAAFPSFNYFDYFISITTLISTDFTSSNTQNSLLFSLYDQIMASIMCFLMSVEELEGQLADQISNLLQLLSSQTTSLNPSAFLLFLSTLTSSNDPSSSIISSLSHDVETFNHLEEEDLRVDIGNPLQSSYLSSTNPLLFFNSPSRLQSNLHPVRNHISGDQKELGKKERGVILGLVDKMIQQSVSSSPSIPPLSSIPILHLIFSLLQSPPPIPTQLRLMIFSRIWKQLEKLGVLSRLFDSEFGREFAHIQLNQLTISQSSHNYFIHPLKDFINPSHQSNDESLLCMISVEIINKLETC